MVVFSFYIAINCFLACSFRNPWRTAILSYNNDIIAICVSCTFKALYRWHVSIHSSISFKDRPKFYILIWCVYHDQSRSSWYLIAKLVHWGRGNMAAILQTTFWSAFSWMEINCLNSDWNFIEVCSWGSNWQYSSIGSDNGLAPPRRQTII